MEENRIKTCPKKAALHNLGCKVNAYETEAMRQMLEEAGYQIVDFSERADVYVINTCSVTNIADRKSRQMLHRAKRQNPDGIVVAVGCYVQTKAKQARQDEAIDILLGNNCRQGLLKAIRSYEEKRSRVEALAAWDGSQPFEPLHIAKTAARTRAFVKVQDGCNQFCSYCIIPYARGRVRSRPVEDVLHEVRLLAQNGCREIVLTGIHLSSYGTDFGESLLHLMQETSRVDGILRIRLGSLDPMIVTEEFAREAAGIDKICPHFHLSLQSGCDATLARMNRRYTTEEYRKSCEWLRRFFTHPAITTDVIVGFPGETEEEFARTKAFLEEIHFYEMHIFKYSRREGTRAASMPDAVSDAVKAERSEALLALERKMSGEFRESCIGKEVEALMEESVEINGGTYAVGYTKEYVKVALKTERNLSNVLVKGRVSGRIDDVTYLMVEF